MILYRSVLIYGVGIFGFLLTQPLHTEATTAAAAAAAATRSPQSAAEILEQVWFVCKWKDCGKAFQSEHNLKKHRQTHLLPFQMLLERKKRKRTTPYSCYWDGCQQAFKNRKAFETHLHQAHSMEHPYYCGPCQKGFKSIVSADRHVKTITHQSKARAKARARAEKQIRINARKLKHDYQNAMNPFNFHPAPIPQSTVVAEQFLGTPPRHQPVPEPHRKIRRLSLASSEAQEGSI